MLSTTPKIAGAAVVILLSLTACGGGSDSTAAPDQQQGYGGPGNSSGNGSGNNQGGAGGGPGGQDFPGASGKVADIDGSTLQVQGESDQTAVTYTGKTSFTNEATVSAAVLKVGDCVRVTSDQTPTDSSTPDATAPVSATRVVISAKVDGSCAQPGGAGGQGGQPPSGAPSGMPTDRPTDLPEGGGPEGGAGGGQRGGFMGGAFGEVSGISDGGFTVESSFQGQSGDATTRTVTVSSDTIYLTNKVATSAAVKVGNCVTAMGAKDDTGAVTATTIAVSLPVDGSCSTGFRFRTRDDSGNASGQTS